MDADIPKPVSVGRALLHIVVLAAPVAFALFITASNSVMALGWVGQFLASEVIMSGVSLGILTFNIFGISILFGVSSGLNTLLAQAEGRGEETVVMRQMYVNRMVIIMVACSIPLGLLNWFSGPLLNAAGQPEEVVVYATNFAHVLFVGNLLPCMTFYLQQQVLNTRRHSLVPLIATIIGTGAQITFSLYFLRGFLAQPLNATDLPLGNESSYLGAAVSRSIGSYVMVTITGLYLIFSRDSICPSGCFCCSRRPKRSRTSSRDGDVTKPSQELSFWSWNGGFKMLLALCGPSMLLMISEWWGFEALAIMAGNLPDAAVCLDANGALYNINLLIYQLYRGFGVGASVYVGNCVGRKCEVKLSGGGLRDVVASFSHITEDSSLADQSSMLDKSDLAKEEGDQQADAEAAPTFNNTVVKAAARDAKVYCWTGLLASIVVQIVISVAYYFLRRPLASIFTADEAVIEKAMNATPAAAVAAVGYAMVMPANMVLQAVGLQLVGAVITTLGYVAVGLPLGALLAFTAGWGLDGIWWGNAAALVSAGTATLIFVYSRVNWENEVRKANTRISDASRMGGDAGDDRLRPQFTSDMQPSGDLNEPLMDGE